MTITLRKKLLTTAIILGAFTFGISPKPASSLVVSDPGMYARAAKELQELKKHFEVLQKQLEEAKRIKESVTGNLGIGKEIYKELGQLQDLAEKMTKSVHNLPNMDLEDYDLKNMEDLQKVIDKVYQKEGDIIGQGQTAKQRKDYQQRSVKGALESSEIIIAKTDERLQKIGRLTDAIDGTETLKEAMDLNNRLLGEILMVQQQVLLLQSQFVRANSALHYQGVDSAQSEGNPNVRGNSLDKIFNDAGKKSKEGSKKMREKMGWEKPPYMY